MDKRRWWWAGVLVLIVAMLIPLWSIAQRSVSAHNFLEAGYQRALFSMIEHVENLNSLLAKGHVIQDGGQGVLMLASAWHEAESARTSLGQLPLGQFNLTSVQKYLAQVGDYSYSMARKLAQGGILTEVEQETLALLSQETDRLNRDLKSIVGDITVRPSWGTAGVTVGLRGQPTAAAGSVADRLTQTGGYLKDQVPALTYDGPFSEHLQNITPRAITGRKISVEQAGRIAEDFVRRTGGSGEAKYRATATRNVSGKIPAYSLTLSPQGQAGQPDIMVDVSQIGGHVLHMINSRALGSVSLGVQGAVQKAEEFIQAAGYRSMITTGSLRHPQTLMVTQVYQDNEVVCYPDFVKVTVALDDGQIIAYDARGYLTSHHRRDGLPALFTGEDARDKAAARLLVERLRPAIIPMSGGDERCVWEVKGRANDQSFLVYYNDQTGTEEKVLQVIETSDGTYTM